MRIKGGIYYDISDIKVFGYFFFPKYTKLPFETLLVLLLETVVIDQENHGKKQNNWLMRHLKLWSNSILLQLNPFELCKQLFFLLKHWSVI